MARKLLSTVIVTVSVLLFLFAIANARAPLDQPANDVSTQDLLESLPKITNPILLPSERPETHSATVVELEPESNNEPKLPEPETMSTDEVEIKQVAESDETATEEPQTMISFRPINRHYFPRRPSLLTFRHHRRFKPWGPRREISYGNDMMLPSEGGEEGAGRRAPERQWAGRFQNRGGPRFWVVSGDGMGSERDEELQIFRPHHHHFLRFHHHHHDHPRLEEDEGEFEERDHGHHHKHEEEEGGIFEGIRKFLKSNF